MTDRIALLAAFLTDMERLKLVRRKAYVSDMSRPENAAEHSWHLALGLVAIAYGPQRSDQYEAEFRCIQRLSGYDLAFSPSLRELWIEYEAQVSAESRWVRVLDRLMPFIVNLSTQGNNWKEQSVSRSQLLSVSQPVREHAPEIYQWMLGRVEDCVKSGWLIDA